MVVNKYDTYTKHRGDALINEIIRCKAIKSITFARFQFVNVIFDIINIDGMMNTLITYRIVNSFV